MNKTTRLSTGVFVVHVKTELIDKLFAEKKLLISELLSGLLSDEACKELNLPVVSRKWKDFPHTNLVIKSIFDPRSSALAKVSADCETVEIIRDFTKDSVYGLNARNKEQNMLLNSLMDNSISCVVIEGRAGSGKAQPLTSKVLTPTGWTPIGQLRMGDTVCTPDGKTASVNGVFPQGKKDIYRVVFSDGSSTECCEEHLWFTSTQSNRDQHKSGSVKSLREIKGSLRYGSALKRNHSIPMTSPVHFELKDLPLDPYILGFLLGDAGFGGTSVTLSSKDKEIINFFEEKMVSIGCKLIFVDGSNCDYRIVRTDSNESNPLKKILEDLELLGKLSFEKSIPYIYKFTSPENRLSILQGLMDSDGFCSSNGMSNVFYSTSEELANDVIFLVNSLGGKAVKVNKQTSYTYDGEKKRGRPSFAVHISMPPDLVPFRLQRKLDRFKPRTKYQPIRYIDSIEFLEKKEAVCISIDHSDHLYITDDFIVTHNTICALAAALELLADRKSPYEKLILTRPMSTVGSSMGALPGDSKEKFIPYLGNYFSNLEYLLSSNGLSWIESMIDKGKIELLPIKLIGGASWHNSIVLADEIQSLTPEQMYALGTRVSENSKLVLMGDLVQRYGKNTDVTQTGLWQFANSEISHRSPHVAYLKLLKQERHPLADVFYKIFYTDKEVD